MTGLRRGDILRIKRSSIKDDGIAVLLNKTRNSTGKRLIIQWDTEGDMRGLVDEILRMPPRRIGDAPLFVTRQGKPYINSHGQCNAFDSLWQQFMDKVMETTKISERFQERDLRAKVASESDSLVEASERLGHAALSAQCHALRPAPAGCATTPQRQSVAMSMLLRANVSQGAGFSA